MKTGVFPEGMAATIAWKKARISFLKTFRSGSRALRPGRGGPRRRAAWP